MYLYTYYNNKKFFITKRTQNSWKNLACVSIFRFILKTGAMCSACLYMYVWRKKFPCAAVVLLCICCSNYTHTHIPTHYIHSLVLLPNYRIIHLWLLKGGQIRNNFQLRLSLNINYYINTIIRIISIL